MTSMRTLLATVALAASMATAQAQSAAPAGTDADRNTRHPADATADGSGAPAEARPGCAATGPGRAPTIGYMLRDQRHRGARRGPGGWPMMGGGAGWMMPMTQAAMLPGGGSMGMMPFDHIEGRIAFYKAELGITDAQLPQWDAFADAMRSSAKGMWSAMSAAMQADMPATAPAWADAMVQMVSARLETMKPTLRAMKSLYAVLSDDQKKTADELVAGHPMGMRAWGMGHGAWKSDDDPTHDNQAERAPPGACRGGFAAGERGVRRGTRRNPSPGHGLERS